jgi:ActR/RegA family two-component response regulator
MTYLDVGLHSDSISSTCGQQMSERQSLLLLVDDDDIASTALQPICEFLDIALERIPSDVDVRQALGEFRPMGVITALDCRGQDGCHVMITVADYDRTLPMMLLIGDEPFLAGAVDAVEEVWRLESVTKSPGPPSVGEIVDFIFRARHKSRCPRMSRL